MNPFFPFVLLGLAVGLLIWGVNNFTGFRQSFAGFRRKSFCDGPVFVPRVEFWCHVDPLFALDSWNVSGIFMVSRTGERHVLPHQDLRAPDLSPSR